MAKVRESLDEVKGLTEYQDQKATRLLTILSFLSALAGGLLTIFSKAYPFQTYLIGSDINWQAVLVITAYALFGVFVVLAISGALVVFYATKTRFKWPKETDAPRSRLFYAGIVSAPPQAWAKSFVTGSGPNKEFIPATELQLSYTKDYILESYLVAAKVADKLRYLMPAQKILYLTVKVMLAWVLVEPRRIVLPLREMFDMCLRRTSEIKHAAPHEGDQIARTSGTLHHVAEALVGMAGYERLRFADCGHYQFCIELGRDGNRAPVRR
jgi:hypothetical protein